VKLARNVMWWALQKHKVSTNYNTLIKDMYDLSGVDTSLTQRIPYPVQIGYRYSWDMPWICTIFNRILRRVDTGIPYAWAGLDTAQNTVGDTQTMRRSSMGGAVQSRTTGSSRGGGAAQRSSMGISAWCKEG
jgi:hypothetical protein